VLVPLTIGVAIPCIVKCAFVAATEVLPTNVPTFTSFVTLSVPSVTPVLFDVISNRYGVAAGEPTLTTDAVARLVCELKDVTKSLRVDVFVSDRVTVLVGGDPMPTVTVPVPVIPEFRMALLSE